MYSNQHCTENKCKCTVLTPSRSITPSFKAFSFSPISSKSSAIHRDYGELTAQQFCLASQPTP